MALFKVFRGKREDLAAQEMHDGYAYFCSDGTFHIDYADPDGNLQRKQINAKDAETLCGMTLEEIKQASFVQSDWNQTDKTKSDFIKNKPEIRSLPKVTSDDDDKTLVVEDGAWVAKKVENGVKSWNDLEDKPFNNNVIGNTLVIKREYLEKVLEDGGDNVILNSFVLVSDNTPCIADFIGASVTIKYDSGEEETANLTALRQEGMSSDVFLVGIENVDGGTNMAGIVVQKDDANIEGLVFKNKGIYAVASMFSQVAESRLTLPNYTFTNGKFKKIDTEVLPDGIGYKIGRNIEILPTTTYAGTGEQDGVNEMFGFADVLDLIGGETYIVNWNGVEYVCVAAEILEDGITAFAIGDLSLIGFPGAINTGEPFIIMYAGPGVFADDLTGMGLYTDGSENVTISITGVEIIHKIGPEYLPDGIGFEGFVDVGNTLDISAEEINESIANGTAIIAQVSDSESALLTSDATPTAEEMRGAVLRLSSQSLGFTETVYLCAISMAEFGETVGIASLIDGDIGELLGFVVPEDNYQLGDIAFSKKGIYFMLNSMGNMPADTVGHFTFPNYTFKEYCLKKIDPKFLPEVASEVTEEDLANEALARENADNALGERIDVLEEAVDAINKSQGDVDLSGYATKEELASKADSDHNHDTVYESKTDAQAKLNEANAYTDTSVGNLESGFVDALVGMYGDDAPAEGNPPTIRQIANDEANTALSSAKSYADGIASNALKVTTENDAAVLSEAKSYTDTVASGKAATVHGTHVSYSGSSPLMDGVASTGGESMVARSDHRHPTDTSRASKEEFDTHTSNTTAHITAAERTNWNAAKTHADTAHAPSNAEKNQNAFSNIAVGSTTVAADTATDTVTFVGSNVTITPDATNDKITFAVADGSTSGKGIVQLIDSTSSTSTTTAATPSSVKSAYDLANTAKTNAETVQTNLDTHTNNKNNPHGVTLTQLGITATAAELNYMDGVISNVQTQIDKTAGKIVAGESFTIDGVSVTAGNGAEIFNNYSLNNATGEHSHAEGYYTTASGNYSHAEGYKTTTSGYASHAEGFNTIASRVFQHAQGKFNISDETSLHIVGNGNSADARSNAHTLSDTGEAWFAGDVYVGSTSGTNKDDGSKKLATEEYVDSKKFDTNVEYGLRFDSATQTLYMTCNGVTVASCIIPLNQAQECGIVGSDGAYIIDSNGAYVVPM